MSYRTQSGGYPIHPPPRVSSSPYASPPPPPNSALGQYGEPINGPYGGSSYDRSSTGRYSPQTSELSQRSIYAQPIAAPYMPTPVHSPPFHGQFPAPGPPTNHAHSSYYNPPPSQPHYEHSPPHSRYEPSPPPVHQEVNGWTSDGTPTPEDAASVGDVQAAVKSLLLATTELQDALKMWSIEQVDETAVSDVYVRIGTEFNRTVHAFAYHNIDLSDIHDVPGHLRLVLEQCLGEDPSPAALDQYMPDVRRVIWELLMGLKHRQAAWRTLRERERGGGLR